MRGCLHKLGAQLGFCPRFFVWVFVRSLGGCAAIIFALTVPLARAQEPGAQSEQSGQADVTGPVSASDIRGLRFGDWMLRCVVPGTELSGAASSASCEIAQPLMVNQDGVAVEVLNLAVSRVLDRTDKEGAKKDAKGTGSGADKVDWLLVVLTPLDVHLASDFGLGVGSANPELVRYRNCNHSGCFVVIPLDDGRISQLKKAVDGAAFFRLLNGQAVKVTFSLKGFTKAFNALSEGQVPVAGQETGDGAAPSAPRSDSEGADR